MRPVLLLSALWLAAPIVAGGSIHIIAIKYNVMRALAAFPLDGGLRVRGRRVFGDNKSLRGAVLIVCFTTLCAMGQAWLVHRFAWAAALTLPGTDRVPPAAWGALIGAGYVLGELPNSFIKRQLDIAPGQAGRGWTRPVFWVLDQVDSLIGVWALLWFVWTPPGPVLLALIGVTLTVHPLAALGMVALGLKDRVG